MHTRLDRIDARERSFAHELAYGTVRLRGRLDHLLDQLLRDGTRSVDPDVLDVLRLGAYQLLELDAVPEYAAVSQTVELAREAGGAGAARLTNGVLRALKRRQAELGFPDPQRATIQHLVAWGAHPQWLVERWVARFGDAQTKALIEANNRRPQLYLRPIGRSADQAVSELCRAGYDSEVVSFAPDAVRVITVAPIGTVLAATQAVVQDPAAGLVTRYAAFAQGADVLDLCAAPGGKALTLAAAGHSILALDVSFERLRLLAAGRSRLAGALAAPVRIAVADARRPPLRRAEAVLLDAPCTGTGTLRRHPDGKWRLRADDLAALVSLQRELLDAAASLVGAGGVLVYATCSLEPEENEDQVTGFLERHAEFETAPPAGIDAGLLDDHGWLSVLPHRWGVDGAFAARLVRHG